MKVLKGQKHGHYMGQTTIALDSVQEANALARAALGDPKFLKESTLDCMRILQANPHYKFYGVTKGSLRDALDELENGNPEIEASVNAMCEKLLQLAKDIEPSLTEEQSYQPSEEGETYDAGKIASDEPMAFFAKRANNQIKSGKGDGAFRILINTDVPWFADPKTQCAALMAVILLVQRAAPCEVWIQQGWMGPESGSGVTVFKAFSGQALTCRHLYFWVGSAYKDTPYSYAINRMLKRQNNGVSGEAEVPCDLYIYGSFMPKITDLESWSQWVAQTARQMLFDEELPDGWSGYGSNLD